MIYVNFLKTEFTPGKYPEFLFEKIKNSFSSRTNTRPVPGQFPGQFSKCLSGPGIYPESIPGNTRPGSGAHPGFIMVLFTALLLQLVS